MLKKWTAEHAHQLEGKKICCVEKSVSYLEELCAKYAILSRIDCIVDANRRNQGSFSFHGRSLPVYGLEHLAEMDWKRTVLLITSDYHQEAYEAALPYLQGKETQVYYFANQETEYEEEYRQAYKDRPLKDLILFRSGPHASAYIKGTDFSDNARALYEYMLRVGLNKTYKLVWLVKHPEEFSDYKKRYDNVDFLSFDWSVSAQREERDTYYEALCFAKYLFFTDAYGFARNCRKEQIRVQLWHGCGFKTRVNFVRCEKRYEYTTVISDLYADIHARIYGLKKEQLLVTGYAKQDYLFHPRKGALSIPDAGKYIFWLPTFRSANKRLEQLNEYEPESETGLPVVNTKEKMERLNTVLAGYHMVLVVKLHPFQKRETVDCEGYSNICLLENEDLTENDVQVNELLGMADALLSDYSSAAVDYMLLDRPIGFLLEDVEKYEKSRGFVFHRVRDWLPGAEIYEYQELERFVEEIAAGRDSTREKRRRLCKEMHQFHDDGSCRRIVEALNI